MKVFTPFLFAVICLTFCGQSLAEKVYKWTDDKGQVHFGQQPPANTPKEIIKTQTGHSEPSPSQLAPETKPGTPAADTADAGAKKDEPPKDQARCELAQKNVETLKTYSHIRMKGDDGQYRYLTPDEQKQKLEEASQAVKESCENPG